MFQIVNIRYANLTRWRPVFWKCHIMPIIIGLFGIDVAYLTNIAYGLFKFWEVRQFEQVLQMRLTYFCFYIDHPATLWGHFDAPYFKLPNDASVASA